MIACELGRGLLGLEPPDAERVRPLVFRLPHRQHRRGEEAGITDVVGAGVRDGATGALARGGRDDGVSHCGEAYTCARGAALNH